MSKLYPLPSARQTEGTRRLRVPLTALFLSVTVLSGIDSQAQSPGGVPPAAWYRADAPGTLFSDAGTTQSTDSTTVYQWNEYTGTGYNLIQTAAGNRPLFSNAKTLVNFNPTVTFNNDYMGFQPATGVNIIDRADGTLYAAGYTNTPGNCGFFGFDESNDYPGLHIYGSQHNLLFFTGGPGYQGISTSAFTSKAHFIAGGSWQNGGGASAAYASATASLNGNRANYTGNQLQNAVLDNNARDIRIGWDNNYGALDGQLNELMIFENKLTSDQMDQVESYMAIKYGTTYANGSKDYKNSAGVTVWTAATNIGYGNNIAGIARDDNGALYQKQSWSVNTGKQVLIGMSLANTNAANTGTLTNGQALIWGDNGLAKIPSVTVTNIPGTNYRFASVWKVQNTGSVGTIRIAWSSVWASLKLVQSSDPAFATGNTITDMTGNTQTINGITYNYADVVLMDGQYFTFAAFVQAPGGVALPAVWLKADAGTDTSVASGKVSGWQNYGYSGGIAGQLSQSSGTAYDYPYLKSNIHNFNPSLVDSATNANGGLLLANVFPDYAQRALSTFVLQSQPDVTQQRTMISYGNNINFQSSPDVPWFASQSATQLYFWWDGSYQQAPALPNSLKRFNSIPTINAYYRPLWTSNPDTTTLSMNGATSILIGNSSAAQGIGNHLYINADGGNNNSSGGNISEIISYDRELTSEEKQRVNTYFSIKYGITLLTGNGANVAIYLNSTGDTVWNATANNGYTNNIAGIAYDYNSGLHQKQSISENDGKQVLIGTTGLANTNALNTMGLTADKQYLVWGDNGLAKSPAIAISGIPGVNYRFGAVWKVQNTNSVGTVRVAWPKTFATMKLLQSTDTTFDATDVITHMADTQVVNGITYAYADVTLGNGQYFTFSAFVQAPGGVAANLLMWHKADDGVTTPGAKSSWRDASVNGRNVTQNNNTAYQPALVTAATDTADGKVYFFNYNPFYYFDGSNDFFYRLNENYFPSATNAGSAYGVMFNSASGGWRTPFGWGDDDPNLVRGNDEYYVTRDNGTVIVQNVNAGEIPAHIGGFSWKGSGAANNGIYLNVNGRIYSSSAYNIGNIDDNFAIGSEGVGLTGNGNEVFQGGIPEVFAYSADHQNSGGDEKLRINSYLALKYGITLTNDSGTAVPNYLSSSSAVVWNATANAGYNNNIAGLAYDYNSALQQKQSVSENAGKQVLIGTTGLANTNALNTTALATDGQFLIWGDNGLAKTPAVYMPGMSTVNVRFKSIWKVQNTGNVGTVRIAWPATELNNFSLIQSADTVFDATDAITGMSANTQAVNGVTYNYADVTLSNGQYFTFAGHIAHAPGGVFAGLSYWYRADKDAVNTGDSTNVTSWTDYAMGTVVGQVGTNAYPLYRAGNAAYFNFNPGISFTDGNQSIGNLLAQAVADTAYDIFTLTKEGITAGGANARVFSVLANKSLTTGNIHYWDGIGINYDGRLERYNTTSGLAYLANPGNIDFPSNSPGIMYHTFTNNTVAKGLNGAPKGTTSVSGPYGMIDGGFIFGSTVFSGNGSDNYSFRGNLGETIIYGANNLTPVDRNKVDAYLAIKYGVTLDTSRSYLSSGSVVVWDKTANKPHYNNVAGIGRDDLSALFQKQSRSQITNNPNNQVTMGLGNIYNTNLANTDSIADGQFLVWGDNGNTQAMTNVAATYTAFTYNGNSDNRRMKRTWKVQNTNVGSALKIRFPIASVGTTTLADESCAQYVILFASDTAFTTNVTAAALTVNGTNYDAIHNFPNGASYFTFAKLSSFTPGLVFLPDTTEATNEVSACTSGPWTYFHRTGDASRKVLATSGLTVAQINGLTVTVTPEGAGYNNGSRVTKLMDRITTVADINNGTYAGSKIRIYYSSAELAAAQVPGALTQSWFRYNSYNPDTIITDIQTDGVFNPGKAIALTPSSAGMEDGIPYVEFLNASPFSSFVYVSSTETIGTVLPVTFLSFTARKQGAVVVLNWTTATESGNKGFYMERSSDSKAWQSIGFVNSAAPNGNSSQKLEYTYTDMAPINGTNYYRLRQTDLDGKYRYSVVKQVSFSQSNIDIYPNPASGYVTIDGLNGDESIKMYDATGRTIKEIKSVQPSATIDLDGLSDGLYHIHISGENGTILSRKVVKVN